MNLKKTTPFILILITMFLWAANFHVVKITLKEYPPMGIATWRFLFGVVSLFIILYFKTGKQLFKLGFSKKEWWYLFLTAFFGIFLTIYFFNVGLKTTSAINGSLIISTTPAITGVFTFFFLKDKLTYKQWLAIAVSFFGVVVILVKGDFNRLLMLKFEAGDIYILLMAIVFSFSQIIVSKYLSKVNATTLTGIASFFALILFTLFSISELYSYGIPTTFSFWWTTIFMGVLGSGVAYVAFYYSVVKIGPTISTLSMNLIPFFAILLAFPFGEKIELVQIAGGIIIIIGIVIFKNRF